MYACVCELYLNADQPRSLQVSELPSYPLNEAVVSEIDTRIIALPTWVVSTVELVNSQRIPNVLPKDVNPETADRSRKFIVEVAEWEQTLHDRQTLALIPRLLAELRILKATLDSSTDEANAAAAKLQLFT